MKHLKNLTIILIVCLVYSCNSDDDTLPQSPEIYGTWHLKLVTNGMDGTVTHYPEDTGDTIVLLIKTNDSLYFFKNNIVDQLGTFKIVQKKSQISNEQADFIIYEEASSFAPYEYLIGDLESQKLILKQDVNNGYEWLFKR